MDLALVAHRVDAADGTGGYAFEILKRISREHKVTLYAATVGPGIPDGVEVVRVRVPTRRAYPMILTFPAAFRAVRRRHDLVHAQGWVTDAADVVTSHIVLRAWREAAHRAGVRAPWGERLFGGFVERHEARLFASARQVIAPSRMAAADLARCYGRAEGVTVIPHGFDRAVPAASHAEARRRLALPSNAFVALYVGDARKGLETAIRALATAERVQLLVLSHSPPGAAAAHAPRVHWAPPGFSLAEAHAAADVLLHPSIYDTFGLVVAEAMARGLPVIVSRDAGVSELIEHGRSGWLLEHGDAPAVAAALRLLAAEPVLRRRLAEGARAVAARHSWDVVARETLGVYERALATRR